VEAVLAEVVGKTDAPDEAVILRRSDEQCVPATVQMYTDEAWQKTPVYKREDLQLGECISPCNHYRRTGTNVIEPNWQAELTERNHNPKALSRQFPSQKSRI